MVMLATNETKKTGAFTFPGIGKLVLVKRKARVGRNPATGEQIKIPAKTAVKMLNQRRNWPILRDQGDIHIYWQTVNALFYI